MFLLVFSATCWKHGNEVSFQNLQPKTARNLIYLIIYLVLYWTSHKKIKKQVQEETQVWLPRKDIMDAISLRVIFPGEDDNTESIFLKKCVSGVLLVVIYIFIYLNILYDL